MNQVVLFVGLEHPWEPQRPQELEAHQGPRGCQGQDTQGLCFPERTKRGQYRRFLHLGTPNPETNVLHPWGRGSLLQNLRVRMAEDLGAGLAGRKWPWRGDKLRTEKAGGS